MTEIPVYFRYWGKAKPQLDGDTGATYHLLAFHSLDVAAVAEYWWDHSKTIRHSFIQQTGLNAAQAKAWVLFFIAVHDYGKWDIRFQRKAPDAFNIVNPDMARMSLPLSQNDIKHYYHGPEGVTWLNNDFADRFASDDWLLDDTDWDLWFPWIAAVAGHHGQIPVALEETNLPVGCKVVEPLLKEARLAWLDALETIFLKPAGLNLSCNPPKINAQGDINNKNHITIMLAGFCSVSDWLGSSDFFPYDTQPLSSAEALKTWYSSRLQYAQQALIAAGVLSNIKSQPSIKKLLNGLLPRQVQCLIEELSIAQNLTIIEAATGSGKTEAALAYAWTLLEHGLADSIVFALPTQATTNAMLTRLEDAADKIFSKQTNLVLAHGRAAYQDGFIKLKNAVRPKTAQGKEEAWVQCGEWLSQSRKRIFLGQIGVCTIDQVLVSVLPVRHKFVRGFGIGRSVLIIDEVHAYDSYMYGLLSGVISQQKTSGGTAILLSATLPAHQKTKLASAWGCHFEPDTHAPYPLITCFREDQIEQFDLLTQRSLQPEKQSVLIELVEHASLLPDEQLLLHIEQAVESGAQVCVICNLVDVAQNLFRHFHQRFEKNKTLHTDQVNLFHSRFTFLDRQHKEQTVVDLFGKKPKPENARKKGHLLVATQVVEQSLDIDFDWMITQLCPVDLLFQRMGRLHRHERSRPAGYEKRQCTILVPDSLDYQLHELIYGNSRVLWRTHELLKKALSDSGTVIFPDAYRGWIEPVYQDDKWEDEPSEIEKSYEKFVQESEAARYSALSNMNRSFALDDSDQNASILTRDGEMSLSIVPFYLNEAGHRILLNGQIVKRLDESEIAEAINLNTVPVPASWGRREDQMPKADINNVIWIELIPTNSGYAINYGRWYYQYDSHNGFHRFDKTNKDSG